MKSRAKGGMLRKANSPRHPHLEAGGAGVGTRGAFGKPRHLRKETVGQREARKRREKAAKPKTLRGYLADEAAKDAAIRHASKKAVAKIERDEPKKAAIEDPVMAPVGTATKKQPIRKRIANAVGKVVRRVRQKKD